MLIDLLEFFGIAVIGQRSSVPIAEPRSRAGQMACDARGTLKAPRRLFRGRH